MEQILDNYIAVAVVFLLLSLIVKGVQDILKYFFDHKEKILTDALTAFMGPNLRLPDILDSLNTVFGRRDAKFLENLTAEQFRQVLDRTNPQAFQGLPQSLGFADLQEAKHFAAAQFQAAMKSFQERYERSMAVWVFLTSLVVVVLFNANILNIYEEIRGNSVTRQVLIGLAENKYKNIVQDSKSLEDARKEIKDIVTDAPIIMRGVIGGNVSWDCSDINLYCKDFQSHPWLMVPGLLFSGFLVYLGAPFWHDLLESLLSAKNVLRKKE